MDIEDVRRSLANLLLQRVAGDDNVDAHRRIYEMPGERWFSPDRPIRTVHGDASMFVGGLRALLLQALHPLAMAGVAGHSGYRGDPWGRLQRTSYFIAVTAFGTAADAATATARVRAVHERVAGTSPDGRPYAASDPHLLKWVHVAEVDSFLRAFTLYGATDLTQHERDEYVADTARVAVELGVIDPPTTEAELAQQLDAYLPELQGTDEALATARFLLFHPPLPIVAWGAYGLLACAAVELLPAHARTMLRLPAKLPFPVIGLARIGGDVMTATVRWALTPAAPRSSEGR